MRNIWTIAKREYVSYFISPVAYAVSFLIFVILGLIFYTNISVSMVQQYAPNIQIVIGPLVTLLLFTTPAITMRTLADERRMGTLELLLTAPIRDWELVVGKWLGAYLFVMTIVAVTWIYPVVLNLLENPGIDQGLLVTGYLGVTLLSACFIAIGITVSSFFTNQIAAFFVTLGALLVFWMLSYPTQGAASAAGNLLRYLDMSEHYYNTFYAGIIELKDIVYYLSMTTLMLFISAVSMDIRRWR